MKPFFKWAGIIFILLIAFIVVAPFLFKDKIVAYVKAEANKQLNASVDFGDFSLSLLRNFPNFSLSINNVSIANKDEFEGDTLFAAKKMSVTINLMSVINGDQYKIRKIELDEPRVHAIVLKNGKVNWDIVKSDSTTATSETKPARFKMNLKKLEIINGYIMYDDASLGFYTLLENFDCITSGDFTQDIFDLQNKGTISQLTLKYGGIAYLNNVKATIDVPLNVDMPNFKFTFKNNEIVLNELSIKADGYLAMPKEDIDMDIQFKADQTDFKTILSLIPSVYTKDFSSVKTKGNFSLEGFVKGVYNEKKIPAFGADIKINDAMFQYPALPKSVTNILADISVKNPDGIPDHTITDIKKFHMEMAGNPVDFKMHIENPVSDLNIDGFIKGKINLSTIKEVVPMQGSDLNGLIDADINLKGRMSSIEKKQFNEFNASGNVTVSDMNYKSPDLPQGMKIKSMSMNFSPQYVSLNGFDCSIGKSDIQANGIIENIMQYVFRDSLLKGTFTMHSSLLDLNEFMTQDKSAKSGDTTALTVIEVPKNINFILKSSLDKVIYDNIDISNAEGTITIKDQTVLMNNVKMNLLQGSMIMNGSYSTQNPKIPVINFDLNVSDFDIPATFNAFNTVQKLAPVAKYTTGKFSTILNYTGALHPNMMPDIKTITGDGKLQTQSIAISGFAPLNKLADALGGMDKFKRTEFSNINFTYHIKNGKITTDEFPFKAGSVIGKVFGTTALDQTIDYTMKMEIPTSDMPAGVKTFVSNQLASINKLGANLQLPEKIDISALFGGTATNPIIKTSLKDITGNVQEAIKTQATQLVKEKVENVKAQASQKLEEQKKKILADAEAQAQKIRDEAKNAADNVRKAGNAEADNLQNKGSNFLEKVANKKLAEKLRKETEEKAKRIEEEGNKKADAILNKAKEQAEKIQ
ncbi:MAG TPA: AsmA-like C-terminal region-containing protein [Chitinophagaceae bacterium]|nr:AsmA-like C-terminal region-containing protein [Chitinophagaceae bacterium]